MGPSSRHARAAGEAIVAGVVAALAWAVIAYAYLRARQWLRFRGLAGRYRVERKLEPEVMCEAMIVEVSGNVLTATARDYQIMHPCIPQTSELRTQKDASRVSEAMMW